MDNKLEKWKTNMSNCLKSLNRKNKINTILENSEDRYLNGIRLVDPHTKKILNKKYHDYAIELANRYELDFSDESISKIDILMESMKTDNIRLDTEIDGLIGYIIEVSSRYFKEVELDYYSLNHSTIPILIFGNNDYDLIHYITNYYKYEMESFSNLWRSLKSHTYIKEEYFDDQGKFNINILDIYREFDNT
jgi:hypothetical protein